MALTSSLSGVIICVVILSVEQSLQICPNTFTLAPVDEGPSTKGYSLYSTNSTLLLTNDGSGYLAVNQTGNTYILYLAKEVDYEILKNSIRGTIFCDGIRFDIEVPINGINEDPPQFVGAPYEVNLTENSRINSTFFFFNGRATDTDYMPQEIFYSIINPSSSPFAISGSQNGTIIVTENLDFEIGPRSYNLNISAAEYRSSMISYTTLTISIIDDDDLGPVFSYNGTYTLSIPEGIYSRYIFNTNPALLAQDGDALNATVHLQLDQTSTSVADKFSILNNGSIQVTGKLFAGQYTINVRAFQVNRPSDRFAIESIDITVYDINDNWPVMSRETYSATVLEDAPQGTIVLTVFASDQDQGINSSFQFKLNGTSLPFNITTEGNVGIIQVVDKLDLENYKFYVYAEEDRSAERHRSNYSLVIITVSEVNNNVPEFLQTSYAFNISEAASVGATVGQVRARDLDRGLDGKFRFAIASQNSGPFLLNSTSGWLTLNCSFCLDFNNNSQYILIVSATDGGRTPLSSYALVVITVLDVNNKAPYFNVESIRGTVSEDVERDTTILQLQAVDDDTPSSSLAYSLEDMIPADWLRVSGTALVTNRSLDAEQHQFVLGRVRVSDGIQNSSISLNISVLDVNDNYPQVELVSHSVEVLENATVGTHVVTVSALDQDVSQGGNFLFYLGPSPSGKFAISSSGSIGKLTVAASFDRRIQKDYNVTITVSDNSAPPKMNSTILYVTIIDSNTAPEFVNTSSMSTAFYNFTVSETASVGSVFGQIKAQDPDSGSSGQIRYSIQSGNDLGNFLLGADTGELTVNGMLDYEGQQSYSIIVNATDNSFEPRSDIAIVRIVVEDVVEAPQWPEYLPVVHLTTRDQHCSDVQLGAQPQDVLQTSSSSQSEVVYSLLNNTQSFSINNHTGLLRSEGPLIVGDYKIGLRACSVKNTSVCSDILLTVQVSNGDIISFCPPFLSVNTNESAETGQVIVDLNSTKGDMNITYLLRNATQLPFQVENTTGIITVHGKLDREETPLYILYVIAVYLPSNGSATAQVTVILEDSPDSPPKFQLQNYQGQISEAGAEGAQVLTFDTGRPLVIRAEDPDINAMLSYSIVAETDNSNGCFKINSTTAELTLKKSIDLESMAANMHGQYTFKVMVSDGYYNDNTTVTVQVTNVNDNGPVFTPVILNFTVNEGQAPPWLVTTLHATDRDVGDDDLVYSLLPQNNLPFSLSQSGELHLLSKLDRETKDFYSFTIMATDHGGRNGTAFLHIKVGDFNEQPEFENSTYTFHVLEGPEGIGSNFTITASDGDIGNNANLTFSIQSGNTNGAFTIKTLTNTTGMLRMDSELDRETTPSLTMILTVQDNGQPPLTASCTVTVLLIDINDNTPVFHSNYRAEVNEDAADNSELQLIPQLSVMDNDTGVFGREGVIFSLENENTPLVPFRVDPIGGHLFVSLFNKTDALDREVHSSYTLMLIATDNNGTGKTGNATVTITLRDVNDFPPTFQQQQYSFNISESVPIGYVVTSLNATDKDNSSSLLWLTMMPSDGWGKFYLNPLSGQLRVSGPLDRETQAAYTLKLLVSDGQYNGSADATITVEDVNDNCPVFNSEQPLVLTVTEKQAATPIYTLNVTDSDTGHNGQFALTINHTVANLYLNLTASGELWTRQDLDREMFDQQSLTFSVWATDTGSPPCVTSLQVQLQVRGLNEAAPEVCLITQHQEPYCGDISVNVFAGSSEGTFLAALTWRDSDEGQAGLASLSVIEDPEELLAINTTSTSIAVLALAKELDVQDLIAKGLLGDDNATYTYTAGLMAVDQGQEPKNSSVSLTLIVLESLDAGLVFPSSVYYLHVGENQQPAVISSVRVVTSSSTSHLNYTLQSAALNFVIDNQGNISTVTQLDREDTPLYSFLVLAWDSSVSNRTATAIVIIMIEDDNDNVPQFSSPHYDITVPENVQDVLLLTLMASDRDAGANGQVTFTLLNTSLDDDFFLNTSSGELHLRKSLNREQTATYRLNVEAADNGMPPASSQAIVHITVTDVNDNAPRFSQGHYIGYLDENSPAATWVQNISASDPDLGLNGYVLYDIQSTNSSSTLQHPDFFIDKFSGALFTSHVFSSPGTQTIYLNVIAHDLGSPPEPSVVNVTIYVNDLSGVLPHVTVDPESVAMVLGTAAGTVVPVSVSAGLGSYSFSIVGGNEDNMFDMNKDSGKLTVTQELKDAKTYQLVIRVINNNAVEYGVDKTLLVTVTSVRMEQEHYAAVLLENTAPHSLLLDINSNAERAGIPVIYTLSEDIQTHAFSIVETTGYLYCNQALDREVRAQYRMQVSVQLANITASGRIRRELSNVAEIIIIVDDVNDNPPYFEVSSVVFGIPKFAAANTEVSTLQAVDPDSGINGKVLYMATRGDTDKFLVTPEGKVTSLVPMDGKEKEQFHLTVRATDENGAGQSAEMEIKIVVVSDNHRFGLVANISVGAFMAKQQFYLRNLSDILNMALQLIKVEPHQGTVIDTTRCDIYFYAFDDNGKAIWFPVIEQRVKENAEAINALFKTKAVDLIPVTETPRHVRVLTKYAMGEVEIAVIAIACLIFLCSFIAIILTFRAWKKQKEFQKQEEAAVKARQKMEVMQESVFITDSEEPLERHRRPQHIETEDQECVLSFGNESSGLDTLTLRSAVLKKSLNFMQEHNAEADSGTENNGGSLSSDEHRHGDTEKSHEENSEKSAVDLVVDDPEHTNLSVSQKGNGVVPGKNKVEVKGVPSDESRTEDDQNFPSQASKGNSLGASAITASDLEAVKSDDHRSEDPAPDYIKRVSFSQILDDHDKAEDTGDSGRLDPHSEAKVPVGFVNMAYQTEDFDNRDLSNDIISTAF